MITILPFSIVFDALLIAKYKSEHNSRPNLNIYKIISVLDIAEVKTDQKTLLYDVDYKSRTNNDIVI